MLDLLRLTSEYCPLEDRLRLVGENKEGARMTLWLTRRLMDQLIKQAMIGSASIPVDRLHRDALMAFPPLTTSRENSSSHGPVRIMSAPSFLIDSIELATSEAAVRLIFQSASVGVAMICFDPATWWQWLAILYRAYLAADWPLTIWPPGWSLNTLPQPVSMPVLVH